VSLTEREFHDKFIPGTFEGTDAIIPYEWPEYDEKLDKALSENRLWTVVLREDLRPSLRNGHHPSHRLYSVITEVRHEEGANIHVTIDDGWA